MRLAHMFAWYVSLEGQAAARILKHYPLWDNTSEGLQGLV
jgi:hypothetical protein